MIATKQHNTSVHIQINITKPLYKIHTFLKISQPNMYILRKTELCTFTYIHVYEYKRICIYTGIHILH